MGKSGLRSEAHGEGPTERGSPADARPPGAWRRGVPVALGAAVGCCIALLFFTATQRQGAPPLHAHSPLHPAFPRGETGIPGSPRERFFRQALAPQGWALPAALADSVAIAPGTWLVGHRPARTSLHLHALRLSAAVGVRPCYHGTPLVAPASVPPAPALNLRWTGLPCQTPCPSLRPQIPVSHSAEEDHTGRP